MQRIGNGYEGLKRFLILMNHPPPCDREELPKKSHAFNKGLKEVTETVMQDACNEIHRDSPD